MSIFFTHIENPYNFDKKGFQQKNLTREDFESLFKAKPLGILSVSPGYIKSNGEVYNEDKIFIPFARELPIKQRSKFSQKSKKIHGKIVSLIHESRNYSYYHWMFETLPKLAFISQTEPVNYYLHYGLKHQRESFKALGIPEKKIINANKIQAIAADEIIIPSAVSDRFDPSDWTIQWLRKILLRNREVSVKRIFINRKDGLGRRVINEDEVTRYLSSQDFQVYNKMSRLGITEQASLFYSALTVIGAHGAALSNIIFCKEETLVVEIFNSKPNDLYKNIAQLCKLRYRSLRIPIEDLADKSARSNFRLNTTLLQNVLQ